MSSRLFGFAVGFLAALSGIQRASAQSFLERITKQIQESIPSSEAPPLQPAEESRPGTEQLPPPRELPPAATSSRGSLGLRVSDVTEDAVRRNQLVVRRGALITAIEKGSVADRAGLPLGGVIVALDGRRVDSPEDLVRAIRSMRPGRDVEITYYDRDRLSRKMIQIPSGQLPDVSANAERQITPVPAPTTGPVAAPQPSLGQQLGGNGNRPLLGRIGQILDIVTPAEAIDPSVPPSSTVVNRVDPEITILRTQVEQLQRQVASLQKSVESLEKKLAERKE